jgi:hypothetical protein
VRLALGLFTSSRCSCAALAGALSFTVVACGSAAPASEAVRACAVQRGKLVSLGDHPTLLETRATTMRQLSRLTRPHRLPSTRLPDEHRTYRVTGQVLSVTRTSTGLRLLISDGTSRRLQAVIPSNRCAAAADSKHRRRIDSARSRAKICSDAVTVGVVFYSPSRRRGLRNGVELAPVLSFTCVAPEIPFGH